MAKSTRSKVKRHFRAKKRTEGVYAAVEAARLNRLHNKLKVLTTRDGEEDAHFPEEAADEQGAEQLVGAHMEEDPADGPDAMELDSGTADSSTQSSKRISTHGPRDSRREQWRLSKGMTPRPATKGINRQGGIAARRKAGRSHRRR